jgi:hypothetical protein
MLPRLEMGIKNFIDVPTSLLSFAIRYRGLFTFFAVATSFTSCPATFAANNFTGPFDPALSNWVFSVNSPAIEECPPTPSSVGSACLLATEEFAEITALKPVSDTVGTTSATWTWTNPGATTYYVSFNYSLLDSAGDNNGNAFATYTIGSNSTKSIAMGANSFAPAELVGGYQSIVFTVGAPFISTGANLAISEFNYAVPTPLPATGAAAAFGYSRRLRRRIKGQRPDGTLPPPVIPAHPSPAAELSLSQRRPPRRCSGASACLCRLTTPPVLHSSERSHRRRSTHWIDR